MLHRWCHNSLRKRTSLQSNHPEVQYPKISPGKGLRSIASKTVQKKKRKKERKNCPGTKNSGLSRVTCICHKSHYSLMEGVCIFLDSTLVLSSLFAFVHSLSIFIIRIDKYRAGHNQKDSQSHLMAIQSCTEIVEHTISNRHRRM